MHFPLVLQKLIVLFMCTCNFVLVVYFVLMELRRQQRLNDSRDDDDPGDPPRFDFPDVPPPPKGSTLDDLLTDRPLSPHPEKTPARTK